MQRVLGIDLGGFEEELRSRYRAALAGSRFLAALPRYEAALRRWYTDRAGCC